LNNTVFEAPIIKKSCNVKFFHFVPLNLEQCPIIITISKGIHQHPPPPPTKTPSNIIKHLSKVLNSEDILNLTSRKLITSIWFKVMFEIFFFLLQNNNLNLNI